MDNDSRRKYIFALLNTVRQEYGYISLEKFYDAVKQGYPCKFSASNHTQEEFDRIVDWIIADVLDNNFQNEAFMDFLKSDNWRFTHAAIQNGLCQICGKDGEKRLMRKRHDKYAICLCDEHYYEYRVKGTNEFLNLYHLEPIKI